jgi:hypothetical protein
VTRSGVFTVQGLGYFFHHGTITGRIGAEDLDATVETASGGLGSTSTVAVDGTLGSAEFTIYAAIDGPLRPGGFAEPLRATRSVSTRHGPASQKAIRPASRAATRRPPLPALAAGALLHVI